MIGGTDDGDRRNSTTDRSALIEITNRDEDPQRIDSRSDS
jgi:hypothetical protein